MVIAGDTSANNGTYLVAWNGHGDALALWKIDLTSGALTLANSYTYTSWGQPTTATHNGIGNLGFRYLYVGRFRVAWDGFAGASLAHMGARHYSPVLGRFLQPDPSAAEANLYAYAENDPVTKVDPSGHCLRCIIDSLVRLAERVRSGLPGFIRTIQNWLQFQFRSFPGSTTFIPRIQQSIRVIGSHPRNFHIVSSGARSGYWRFTSVLQGGGERAAQVFEQIAGRLPSGSLDHVVGYHRYFEVVYRSYSRSGGPVVEVFNNVLRTHEIIHFPPG